MKKDDIHRNLLEALEKKFHDKAELVERLMEILFMEKGAIYRRLRGEVPFSFYEVVMIAEKLNIPFGNLIYFDSMQGDRFELNITDYTNFNDADYKQWEEYLALIKRAKDDPLSEMAESSNILPLHIHGRFNSLSKYFLFKYQYLFSGKENRTSYSNIVFPEKLCQVYLSFFNATKHFANATYIWDHLIFQYLVTDIKYFFNVNLISSDDIQQIKEDLFSLLDYIEKIALNGCFEETGKPVSFYISDINLEADYLYFRFNDLRFSHVKTFILNTVISTHPSSYEKIKNWIQSLKKSSTLITQSGAVFRADFFEKQRMIISEL